MLFWGSAIRTFLLVALILLATVRAEAGKDEFEAFLRGMKTFYVCDGLPPPLNSDEYTGKAAASLKIRPDGLAACDAALADPSLRPDFQVRKVSLLQGKALQLIGVGRSKEALSLLDEARAIQTPLTPSQRSRGLDLANDGLRAIALGDISEVKLALAAVQRMEAARPLSMRVLVAGVGIRFRLGLSVADQISLLKQRAALDPLMGVTAMRLALLDDQPNQVVAIGTGLRIVEPIARKGWKSEEGSGFMLLANAEIDRMLANASKSINQQKEIDISYGYSEEELIRNFSDVAEIYSKLNYIENEKNQIKYFSSHGGVLIKNSGIKFIEMNVPHQWTVQFINKKSTLHSIDEYTIFSAAIFCKKNRYSRFIIEGRKFSSYSTQWRQGIGVFTLSGTDFKGDETQLVIRLLNSSELPKDLAGSEWRIIEADEILRTLAPVGKAVN